MRLLIERSWVQIPLGKKLMTYLNLNYLFIIPVIGIIFIIFNKETKAHYFALITSIIAFLYSIILYTVFDPTLQFQFTETLSIADKNILFGVDGISINFLLLTAFITPICVLVSKESIKIMKKEYYIFLISIELILFGVFTILDLLGFYILYEAVLIPMFLIIGI